MSNAQIHWFSILNSLVVVFFLAGVLAAIIIRTLKKDIANYNRLDEEMVSVLFWFVCFEKKRKGVKGAKLPVRIDLLTSTSLSRRLNGKFYKLHWLFACIWSLSATEPHGKTTSTVPGNWNTVDVRSDQSYFLFLRCDKWKVHHIKTYELADVCEILAIHPLCRF